MFHGACRFRVAVGELEVIDAGFQAQKGGANQVIPGPRSQVAGDVRFMSKFDPAFHIQHGRLAQHFQFRNSSGKLVGGDGFPVHFRYPGGDEFLEVWFPNSCKFDFRIS